VRISRFVNPLMMVIGVIMVVTMGSAWHHSRNSPTAEVGSVSMKVKDLSNIGISIITQSDPSFSTLLSTSLDGETKTAAQTLSNVSFFIKNDTDQPIIGYAIKWEMTAPDGKPHTHVKNYLASDVLVGRPVTGLVGVINSHSVRFVSLAPIEEINRAREAGGSLAARANAFPLAEQVERLRDRTSKFTEITISMDSVLLADGTFWGPDTFGEFDKIQARLDARRDLLRQFETSVQSNSPSSAFERLREIANTPRIKRNSLTTPNDIYKFQQQTSASELLGMREQFGESETIHRYLGSLRHSWLQLKRR